MKVWNYIEEKLEKHPLYFVLIDPDETGYDQAPKVAYEAQEGGADVILVGGTVGVQGEVLDSTVKAIREAVDIPVILFPGDISGISKYADAILYISLLNSRNPYYISGVQALAAPILLRYGLEIIPTAYLITEPGQETAAGWVGDARPLPRRKPSLAATYALAAKFIGFKMIYLEAGSGASYPVDSKIVAAVRKVIGDFPYVIVGGGIRTPEVALEKIKYGADVIVTGTIVEIVDDVRETVRRFSEAIHSARRK